MRFLIALASLAGLVPAVHAWLTLFRPGPGWIDVLGYPAGRDFVNFWTAGRVALTGTAARLYDLDSYHDLLRQLFFPEIPFLNVSYPPSILPLIAPLGALPYGIAFIVWSVLGTVALLAATFIGIHRPKPLAVVALLLAPAVLFSLVIGQASLLLAAAFVAGFRLRPARPILAGILFSLMALKPHFALTLPVYLIVVRDGRCIAAAIMAAAALVGVSLVVYGTGPWLGFLDATLAYQGRVIREMQGFYTILMFSPYALLRQSGFAYVPALALHGAVAVCIIAVLVRTLLRLPPSARSSDIVLAQVTLAACVVTPYSLVYDLALPAAALAGLAARSDSRTGLPASLALAAFWLVPLAGMYIALMGWPASTIAVLVAALVMLLRPPAPESKAGPA